MFYEVFLELLSHGKKIGKQCVCLKAGSPFKAALEAEKKIEALYGNDVLSHTLKVDKLSPDEFNFITAA